MQNALVELCAILTLGAATSIPVNGPPRVYWFGMRWSRGSFPGNSSPPTLRIHFVLTPGLALVLCFLPQCCVDAAVAGYAFDLLFVQFMRAEGVIFDFAPAAKTPCWRVFLTKKYLGWWHREANYCMILLTGA